MDGSTIPRRSSLLKESELVVCKELHECPRLRTKLRQHLDMLKSGPRCRTPLSRLRIDCPSSPVFCSLFSREPLTKTVKHKVHLEQKPFMQEMYQSQHLVSLRMPWYNEHSFQVCLRQSEILATLYCYARVALHRSQLTCDDDVTPLKVTTRLLSRAMLLSNRQ